MITISGDLSFLQQRACSKIFTYTRGYDRRTGQDVPFISRLRQQRQGEPGIGCQREMCGEGGTTMPGELPHRPREPEELGRRAIPDWPTALSLLDTAAQSTVPRLRAAAQNSLQLANFNSGTDLGFRNF